MLESIVCIFLEWARPMSLWCSLPLVSRGTIWVCGEGLRATQHMVVDQSEDSRSMEQDMSANLSWQEEWSEYQRVESRCLIRRMVKILSCQVQYSFQINAERFYVLVLEGNLICSRWVLLFILIFHIFSTFCSFQGVEYPGFTLQCHQLHQWHAYSMETAVKEILHLDILSWSCLSFQREGHEGH